MRAERRLGLALALFAALLGCTRDPDDSGLPNGEEDSLKCEWFAGDNCWKRSVEAAAPCALAGDEPGVLSADGSGCAYGDRGAIAFHAPFDPEALDAGTYEWDLSIEIGDRSCLSWKDIGDTGFTLETSAGPFEDRLEGIAVTLTCPNGREVHAADAFDLLECGDGGTTNLPGSTYSWTATAAVGSGMSWARSSPPGARSSII